MAEPQKLREWVGVIAFSLIGIVLLTIGVLSLAGITGLHYAQGTIFIVVGIVNLAAAPFLKPKKEK
jgi:hypothetical protein